MDLFPLFNSLRISLIATLITLVTGILAAYFCRAVFPAPAREFSTRS
jgi:ABC-type spermidine/putrescine transport system permease subunit I